jgi:hypothetical protein
MYAFVLLMHSWLRHFVVIFGVWLLVASFRGMKRGHAWSVRDEATHTRFLALLDTQLLLGLVLYFWLSPIAQAAFRNLGASMKDPTLRFFGVEHVFAMLLGVVVAHVGRVRSKKREGKARYKATFITQLAWLVLTLSGIPWPGLDIGRPLFRM